MAQLIPWVNFKAGVVATFCLAGLTAPAFAQYEDLVDLPDAPTITKDKEGVICTVEGVQFSSKANAKGGKDISIVYLLTQKPSAYFNYYDAVKKAIVFDFYDTHIGESAIDPIKESPFTTSTVEPFKIDLNKDVEGLKPDIRDVVRVSLYTPYDIPYDVQEDESVITMSFKWSSKVENKMKRAKTAFYWEFPLAVVGAAGAGFAAYEIWLKPAPTTSNDPFPPSSYPVHPQ